MKKSGNNILQSLINIVISGSKDEKFKLTFNNLSNVDKDKFKEVILHNKLAANFIDFIGKNNLESLFDHTFLENCRNQKTRFQVNSLNSIREVHLLNELFAKEDLNPIFLKGVALQREYKDIALRPFVDIDILFDKSEILKAYQILHKREFLDSAETQYINEKNIEDFCRNFHHISLITKNGISIELHHRITPVKFFESCPITENILINHRKVDFHGKKINLPSINDLLVHQLCHFSFSDFNGLMRTISDLRAVTENYEVNFYMILSNLTNEKIIKSLILSLEVINSNGVPIQDLKKVRSGFGEYCPNDAIILEAQIKLFSRKKFKGDKFYKNFYRPGKAIDVLAKRLFPHKSSLIYEYKISNPNNLIILKTYISHIYKQIVKLKNLPAYLREKYRDANSLKYTNDTDLWLNGSE